MLNKLMEMMRLSALSALLIFGARARADDGSSGVKDFLRAAAASPAPATPRATAVPQLIDGCIARVAGQEAVPKPSEPPPPPEPPKWMKVAAPEIADDLSADSAAQAFDDTAAYWTRRPDQKIDVAGRTYTGVELAKTLGALAKKLRENPSAARTIGNDFDVFQSLRKVADTSGKDSYTGDGKVTGYYGPQIPIEKAPRAGLTAIMRKPRTVPPDPTVPAGGQPRKVSRCQILDGALAGQGLEIYWTRPSFLMSLQTEGSGFGAFPDGSRTFLEYGSSNGRKWRGISGALLDVRTCCLESKKNCGIPPKAMGGKQLLAFLQSQTPGREKAMTCLDPSFVFFDEQPGGRPTGSLGVRLTAGRSVAVDPTQVPLGLPGLLSSNNPPAGAAGSGPAFTRLVVTHDVGGAIKGGARVDLYWGEGPAAEDEGGRMNAPGRFYVLLPKRPQSSDKP
jgi:membrane-bound lytic murein transglycosylase A